MDMIPLQKHLPFFCFRRLSSFFRLVDFFVLVLGPVDSLVGSLKGILQKNPQLHYASVAGFDKTLTPGQLTPGQLTPY